MRRIHKIPIIMLYKRISGQFQVPTGDVILVKKKHQCTLILYVQLHHVVMKHYELLYTAYECKLLEIQCKECAPVREVNVFFGLLTHSGDTSTSLNYG